MRQSFHSNTHDDIKVLLIVATTSDFILYGLYNNAQTFPDVKSALESLAIRLCARLDTGICFFYTV